MGRGEARGDDGGVRKGWEERRKGGQEDWEEQRGGEEGTGPGPSLRQCVCLGLGLGLSRRLSQRLAGEED